MDFTPDYSAIIQDRNQSGLSVKDYCAQHQLSRDSYYYWLRKVKETLLTESGFVEVTQPKKLPVPETTTADPKKMMTLTSVSYTHLDVYKRQTIIGINGMYCYIVTH